MIRIPTTLVCLWLALWLAPALAADQAKLKIEAPDGTDRLVFKRKGDTLKILDGADRLLLKARPRDDGGRKYKGPDGDTRIKVSGDDQGFKLKTEHGSLLWKVKRDGNRIRISNNEQNVMADELKRTGRDKWVAERDGRPLGKVKYYRDKGKIKVKDAGGRELYRIEGAPLSPLYAVPLVTGIPEDEAQAIMAEMWLRGW